MYLPDLYISVAYFLAFLLSFRKPTVPATRLPSSSNAGNTEDYYVGTIPALPLPSFKLLLNDGKRKDGRNEASREKSC